MKKNIKATFTLPVDLLIYLQSKENQAAFVAEAIKKAKEEEESRALQNAACEMENCEGIWDELEDWNNTLEDGINE